MIKYNEIKTDFEKIATAIKQNNGALKALDFAFRLVIHYTDDDKAKYNNNYNYIVEYSKKLDTLNIPFKSKDNKYFYMLNKTLFDTNDNFIEFQKGLMIKGKQLTINAKNLDDNKKELLNFALNEMKKEYSNK